MDFFCGLLSCVKKKKNLQEFIEKHGIQTFQTKFVKFSAIF